MLRKLLFIGGCCLLSLPALLLAGCAAPGPSVTRPGAQESQTAESSIQDQSNQEAAQSALSYQVNPGDFSLSFLTPDGSISVSSPGPERKVEQYKENGEDTTWLYPEENISVSIRPVENYLSVTITSESGDDSRFTWPAVSAGSYYLPFSEGKRIPASDQVWKEYLDGQRFTVLEELSMPFWAALNGDQAILFILEDPFRTEMDFSSDPSISFSFTHHYPDIDSNRSSRFRIYLMENNPVTIAKQYKKYVEEKGSFVTLEQKAAENPNVKKLYGAPFIYLWGEFVLSPSDVRWPAFRDSLNSPVMDYMLSFSGRTETGAEFESVISAVKNQDYVDAYQKNIICRYISEILTLDDFFNSSVLVKSSPELDGLLKQSMEELSASERIEVNKYALSASLPKAFPNAENWMDNETVDLIKDLKEAGLDHAWIGLHGWEQALQKPELVKSAADLGYLIGSYDSYHSIHEPGKEQWSTAKFEDLSLYDKAVITDKDGKKAEGFKGVGRKLNPTLSLPSVKTRMDRILGNNLPFNSWFIDCDATGEIYDDYTPEHVTTQQEELAARMERISYIRDSHKMVVGSEGGNDFAAPTIAFAHGIELKTFSWMDPDMKENKESDYYIGKYYSASGGVAEHFSKRIPVKDKYYSLFVDPRYDVPLYKLVYNDSVITSYHWDWSTFKIKGATQDRMVREVLYNVPPLYHLDRAEWERYGQDITAHTDVWSAFSQKAVNREMTDFSYLNRECTVQMTRYGEDLQVVANFDDSPYKYKGQEIPGHSALIKIDGSASLYTPSVSPENL